MNRSPLSVTYRWSPRRFQYPTRTVRRGWYELCWCAAAAADAEVTPPRARDSAYGETAGGRGRGLWRRGEAAREREEFAFGDVREYEELEYEFDEYCCDCDGWLVFEE